MSEPLSYKSSGVDVANADATKRAMASSLETKDPRVLNRLGAFASLFSAQFPGIVDPVLVMKMEEPGSKQKLALENGRVRSLCFDLVNHLINDIAVMGAIPLAVQDCIVCGKLEQSVVRELVQGMADACREQHCSLVGGETSEQPGIIPAGTYILSASVVGVVDRAKIVDGSTVTEGDVVLAVGSSGLHTNGYSLVRALLGQQPQLAESKLGSGTFFDAIMEPHLCYLKGLKPLIGNRALHALAHITGGGIEGNLNRVIPSGLCAKIDVSKIKVLPVFSAIQKAGKVSEADMLKTFNLGVGLTAVCEAASAPDFIKSFSANGYEAYPIGVIEKGADTIQLTGRLSF